MFGSMTPNNNAKLGADFLKQVQGMTTPPAVPGAPAQPQMGLVQQIMSGNQGGLLKALGIPGFGGTPAAPGAPPDAGVSPQDPATIGPGMPAPAPGMPAAGLLQPGMLAKLFGGGGMGGGLGGGGGAPGGMPDVAGGGGW